MLRWLALFLLVLNLGFLLWGWTHDRPIDEALPAVAQARGEIRLVSEQPLAVEPSAATQDPVPTGSGSPAPRPATATVPMQPEPVSASASNGGAIGTPPRVSLPETRLKRVAPGQLPDGHDAEPPLVKPPVRDADPGITHTWARDRAPH